jgi:hypothetical protein
VAADQVSALTLNRVWVWVGEWWVGVRVRVRVDVDVDVDVDVFGYLVQQPRNM